MIRTRETIMRRMEEMSANNKHIRQTIIEFNEMSALDQRMHLALLVRLLNHPFFLAMDLDSAIKTAFTNPEEVLMIIK